MKKVGFLKKKMKYIRKMSIMLKIIKKKDVFLMKRMKFKIA